MEHVPSGSLALTRAVTGLSPGPSCSSQSEAGASPSKYASEIADSWSPHQHTKRQTSVSPERTLAKPSVTEANVFRGKGGSINYRVNS